MVTRTWTTRELPVLLAVLELEEAGEAVVTGAKLAEMAGIGEAEAKRAFDALAEDGFLSHGQMVHAGRSGWAVMVPRLRGKGRRAVDQWPANGFDALVAIIGQRIQDEAEPAERSKLERLRDAILGVGRDVATDVLGAAIKHAGGI